MTVENRKKDRRIISLSLDEPPRTEPGMIGIKLNMRALGDPQAAHRVSLLDEAESLKTFFQRYLRACDREKVFWQKHKNNDRSRKTDNNTQGKSTEVYRLDHNACSRCGINKSVIRNRITEFRRTKIVYDILENSPRGN